MECNIRGIGEHHDIHTLLKNGADTFRGLVDEMVDFGFTKFSQVKIGTGDMEFSSPVQYAHVDSMFFHLEGKAVMVQVSERVIVGNPNNAKANHYRWTIRMSVGFKSFIDLYNLRTSMAEPGQDTRDVELPLLDIPASRLLPPEALSMYKPEKTPKVYDEKFDRRCKVGDLRRVKTIGLSAGVYLDENIGFNLESMLVKFRQIMSILTSAVEHTAETEGNGKFKTLNVSRFVPDEHFPGCTDLFWERFNRVYLRKLVSDPV